MINVLEKLLQVKRTRSRDRMIPTNEKSCKINSDQPTVVAG